MKLLIEILDFLLAHVGLSHPEKASKVKELRQRLAAKMGLDPDDYDEPEPPQQQTQEKKPAEATQQEQQQQQ